MVSKQQLVKFEAYLACSGDKDVVDISNLLFKIAAQPNDKRKVKLYGVPVRIDKVEELTLDDNTLKKYPDMKLIYFHMSKLRDDGIAITKQNIDDLVNLDLEADEYIAEDISCIFDVKNSVLFVQRNFHSLSPVGIKTYLIEMKKKMDNETITLDFKPVPDKKIISKLKKVDNVRKLELSFGYDSYKQFNLPLKKYLGVMGEIFDKFVNGVNVSLVLSAGYKKDNPFKKENTTDAIQRISNDNSIFSKAIISGKTGSMPVEKYDLINGKLQTKYSFSSVKQVSGTTKKIHLDQNSVRDVMKELYLDRATESSKPFMELVVENLH
ncbi:DUF6731 family protein [Ligilactobacillus salivarius]|uniref:Uncharacterized protein n=1 Tax=Ligilactobacillus salivarius TaxID=1624 RepID=A0AAW6Q0W4_9LACO|nr:DUF6731 family protein [Ligilactobacillus salivarius]MDF4186119.1 hypothetical protein [Ligilactobacillus salivarius]